MVEKVKGKKEIERDIQREETQVHAVLQTLAVKHDTVEDVGGNTYQ